jgi:hypothetical protein
LPKRNNLSSNIANKKEKQFKIYASFKFYEAKQNKTIFFFFLICIKILLRQKFVVDFTAIAVCRSMSMGSSGRGAQGSVGT